jgi:hypothetical protein
MSEEELLGKLFLFQKYGEIPISTYLNHKLIKSGGSKSMLLLPYVYGIIPESIEKKQEKEENLVISMLESFYIQHVTLNNKGNMR